jgi:hypothetical protein
MLPDFPRIKERLLRLVFMERQERIRADELVGAIRRVPYFEGQMFASGDVDGHVEHTESEVNAFPYEIDRAAIIERGVDAMRESLAKATAVEIQAMRQMLLRKVSESVQRVGNDISAEGRPFSADLYFKMLDTVQIDFDELERPDISGTRIVVHPDQAERVEKLMEEWQRDESFQQRYQEVMLKKRDEWRDRESNRKLVD